MNRLVSLAFVAMAGFAYPADRLLIEVVPLEVRMEVHEHWTDIDKQEWEFDHSGHPRGALAEALARTHEALVLLGVPGDAYDLRVSDARPETILCTPIIGDSPSLYCVNQLDTSMMVRLGHSREHKPGHIALGLLLFPAHPSFQWGPGYLHGAVRWWSTTTYEPRDLHWSTSSCSGWSAPWTHTIAHELGHCFGLYHTSDWDNDDANEQAYGSFDFRSDLMTARKQGGNLMMNWLKPTNVERIRDHFRTHNVSSQSVLPGSVGEGRGVSD